MEAFLQKLSGFNRAWNDLPRKGLVVVGVSLLLAAVWAAFPYGSPLVCALVFSWAIRPMAYPLEKLFEKIHISRRIAALIASILLFGVLTALVALCVSVLSSEAKTLIKSMPTFVADATEYINEASDWVMEHLRDAVSDDTLRTIYDMLMTGLSRLSETLTDFAGTLVSFTWSAVTTLPDILLFVLFMVMESYYLVADREKNRAFFRRQLPQKVSGEWDRVKNVVFKGIRAQVEVALIEMLVVMVFLFIGFWLLKTPYALMLAILIALLDALPVIGAGLIMIPMTLFYLFATRFAEGFVVLAMWVLIQVIKRVLEPKLLGRQMKLNQLATMVSMYAGYRMMGYLGLLIGPMFVIVLSAVLDGTGPAPEKAPITKKRGRKK